MNEKDKKAFEKWHEENISNPPTLNELITRAWQAACEYKQKEIDELLKQLKHEHDLYKKHLKVYEGENEKLRSVVMLASEACCYTDYEDACSLASNVLKELENK